jgi:hypothetical protein
MDFWIFTMVLMWMLVNQRQAIYCWVGVADLVWDCLEVRCGSYWFLNHFLNEKLNKIETEKLYWNLGAFLLVLLESSLVMSNLIEFISQFSELRCRRYWVFEWILLVEIQSNYKNWVWKPVELSMCSHCQIAKFSILKMWKIKNVFTHGPRVYRLQ